MDYYQILHISEKASQEEIRKAYRKLAVKYHPDNAGEQAREQFDKVQEAYGVLGDEEKRAAYDERRRGGEAAYKNSFEQFFKKGMQNQAKQESNVKPMNTDALFETYFKCN